MKTFLALAVLPALLSLDSYAQTNGGQPLLGVQLYAGITITGTPGVAHSIEYTTNLMSLNSWRQLTNFNLPQSPYLLFDASSPATQKRFYRATALYSNVTPISNMVWIPSGTFTMGSPTNELGHQDNEGPQTQVTLTRGFWISRFEVTRREFGALMGFIPGTGIYLDQPVDNLTWNQAVQYCTTLTSREVQAGRIPNTYSYRLPTEAQWEYAARSETSTRFFFGDDPSYTMLPNYAWNTEGSEPLHIVGGKLPNAWGLHDVYGNAGEMCIDYYDLYPGGSVVDWTGPPFNTFRVVRGAWAKIGRAHV